MWGEGVEISKKQIKPGIIVLELAGRIQMGPDCKRIDSEVEEQLRANQSRLIFDLTRVNHIDSAAVGQIVKCYMRLMKSGGGLRLAGATGMVEGVLQLTQVHQVIPIFSTALEASENFPLRPTSP
jgi:anti-sigma B factor antagonist